MVGVYGCLVTLEYTILFDTKLGVGFLCCCLVEVKLAVVSFFLFLMGVYSFGVWASSYARG